MSTSIENLIGNFYEAFSGKPELLDAVLTEDWDDIPLGPGEEPGRAGLKAPIDALNNAFSDFRVVVEEIIDARRDDGNGMVGVRAKLHGVHTGEFSGIAPTGREAEVPAHDFHEIVDGRIVRTHHMTDWLSWFQQVGSWPSNEAANKALVLKVLTELFEDRNFSAFDRYFTDSLIQHNPRLPDGTDALRAVVTANTNVHNQTGMVTASGDIVMVHRRVEGSAPKPIVGVDIYRIEDGRIAEHWDVLQEEVSPTASGHPMFTMPSRAEYGPSATGPRPRHAGRVQATQ
jgi:predicted SnoaL-like aldol condensation-catalyzing enzyme